MNERPFEQRVRMHPVETIGGHGTQARDMIPITLDDSVINDVLCYVYHAHYPEAKQRAAFIVDRLNMADAPPAEAVVDPAPAAAAFSIADIEKAIDRGDLVDLKPDGTVHYTSRDMVTRRAQEAVAALLVGVDAAIGKLHRIIAAGEPLDAFAALDQLEGCMLNAGIDPPARPPAVEDAVFARAAAAQPPERAEGENKDRREPPPGSVTDRDGYNQRTAKGPGYQVRASDADHIRARGEVDGKKTSG